MAMIKFQLDKSQKTKLIEILLIVGSIVAAFKIPASLIWIFMLFVLCSILYYIVIQKEGENISFISIISAFISGSFVGIIIYNFAVSLMGMYPVEYRYIFLVIAASVMTI